MSKELSSPGEDFVVEWSDRSFGSPRKEVLKVAGADGTTTINGSKVLALGGSGQVVAGDLAANAVTTIKIADNAVTTAKINAAAVTTAKLASNAVTGPALSAAAFRPLYASGVAAAGPVTLTGAKIGDKVIQIINLTDSAGGEAAFEATVTVNDQIQQSSASDLSTKKFSFLLIAKS